MKPINLSQIWIDVNIFNMVQKQGCIFPENLEPNIVHLGTFPLQQERLEQIKKMDSDYPIKVKVCLPSKKMYEVLDGRHRIVNCILQGKEEILCDIID